jgi:hypothetical protein
LVNLAVVTNVAVYFLSALIVMMKKAELPTR